MYVKTYTHYSLTLTDQSFTPGIKSYSNSTAQSFGFALSAFNEKTTAHTVMFPTL